MLRYNEAGILSFPGSSFTNGNAKKVDPTPFGDVDRVVRTYNDAMELHVKQKGVVLVEGRSQDLDQFVELIAKCGVKFENTNFMNEDADNEMGILVVSLGLIVGLIALAIWYATTIGAGASR